MTEKFEAVLFIKLPYIIMSGASRVNVVQVYGGSHNQKKTNGERKMLWYSSNT